MKYATGALLVLGLCTITFMPYGTHAATSGAVTNSASTTACIGTAVSAREDALDAALVTYVQSIMDAFTLRNSGLKAAYATNKGSALRDAISQIRSAFGASMGAAHDAWPAAKQAIGAKYDQDVALCGRTKPVSKVLFSDDFHRADSDSTGNGWTDVQIGGSSTWGINDNRQIMTGNGGGTPWIYRTDILKTSGIAIKGEFSSPNLSDGYFKTGIMSSNGYADSGYYILINGQANEVSICQTSSCMSSTAFTFNDSDHFSYEWDITSSPQNWSNLYVWDSSTGTKPPVPTLSWTNDDSDFSPNVTGNRSYILNGVQGTHGTETMYQYLYRVESL